MERDNMTPERVAGEHRRGVRFNRRIELYDAVETNENFFIGKQWEGVQANGMPTPVFNFLKRVVLFAVANVATDNLTLHASPMAAEPLSVDGTVRVTETVTDLLTSELAAVAEENRLGALLREFARNAAVDGDGCTYTYWDPEADRGGGGKGAIRTEILQNTQVHFGNPNCRDVECQPYILIERRALVEEVRRRVRENGGDESAVEPDEKSGAGHLDALGGGKVTVLLRLWKDEDTGTVWGYECAGGTELRKPWDLGLSRYPITWMSWDFVRDCYHGQAMITGLIPNQIFVNKLFAMSMISLMSLAYPKVIYDRTKVARWSNRVGAAIGVSGSVDGVARIMGPAAVSPQISQFIELAVNYTQRFLGASDVALGDVRPDNASAIIALQRSSAVPIQLTKQDLLQSVEDLGRIYLDFMATYYSVRTVETDGVLVELDFSVLKRSPVRVKLDVGASAYWSEIAAMQTLDNLLRQGRITTVEYLKRLPAGQITDRDALIEALEQAGKEA